MRASELSTPTNPTTTVECKDRPRKPPFRPAKDDTKLVLQDPIRRSDPIETEEAVLRPPPFQFSVSESKNSSKMG
ncbi:hypothetical protein SDJN02_02625 [Cucurbita argyrosperma subsp. argyrosperma]|nr:hypothetical protein SDJN02_02625 [Cucurbita argyrosperma subsp. argyrosperma]